MTFEANTLPAEAIDLDALAELARKATPGPWIRSGIQQRMTEKSLGAGPDGRLLFFSPLGATNNDQAQCIRDMDFIAALDPQTVLALIDLARRADDHYFAVDYTGCIHEAPDRETAIKWAEDFARTANGGAIGSERPEVAAAIGSLARLAAVPSEQEPVAYRWRPAGVTFGDVWSVGVTPPREKSGWTVEPLYVRPAPAAGVTRWFFEGPLDGESGLALTRAVADDLARRGAKIFALVPLDQGEPK